MELTSGMLLWVPPGYAHAFQALEDSLFLYLVAKEYSPQHERCILWNDPSIGINWPFKKAIVSERDAKGVLLREALTNFEYPI